MTVTGETVTTASGLKYIDQVIATSGAHGMLCGMCMACAYVHGMLACARTYLLASRMARPESDGREHRRL